MRSRLRRKLFNRPIEQTHALFPCIDGTCTLLQGLKVGVLNNLVLDHRVTPQREEAFLEFCLNELRSHPDLVSLLAEYQEREVQLKNVNPSIRPAYLRTENTPNLLHGDLNFETELIDPSTRLVTVKTHWPMAQNLFAKLASKFGSRRLNPEMPGSMLNLFFELPESDQKALLSECLGDSLNISHGSKIKGADPGCAWATFESDIEDYLKDNEPSLWFEYLGLFKRCGEGIVFAVAYKISDTGGLARPTQLDAGNYAPHLPPPPIRGHLSRTLPWGSLCGREGAREMLLHQEVVDPDRFEIIRWQRYKFDQGGPTPEELHRARYRRFLHWIRHSREYRNTISQWIK